jgi:hypothetical protein
MKTIPLTPDTEALARRLVWFDPPVEALSDTSRFVAYALACDCASDQASEGYVVEFTLKRADLPI